MAGKSLQGYCPKCWADNCLPSASGDSDAINGQSSEPNLSSMTHLPSPINSSDVIRKDHEERNESSTLQEKRRQSSKDGVDKGTLFSAAGASENMNAVIDVDDDDDDDTGALVIAETSHGSPATTTSTTSDHEAITVSDVNWAVVDAFVETPEAGSVSVSVSENATDKGNAMVEDDEGNGASENGPSTSSKSVESEAPAKYTEDTNCLSSMAPQKERSLSPDLVCLEAPKKPEPELITIEDNDDDPPLPTATTSLTNASQSRMPLVRRAITTAVPAQLSFQQPTTSLSSFANPQAANVLRQISTIQGLDSTQFRVMPSTVYQTPQGTMSMRPQTPMIGYSLLRQPIPANNASVRPVAVQQPIVTNKYLGSMPLPSPVRISSQTGLPHSATAEAGSNQKLACEKCCKQFYSQWSLNHHILTAHAKKMCKICMREFQTEAALTAHAKSHYPKSMSTGLSRSLPSIPSSNTSARISTTTTSAGTTITSPGRTYYKITQVIVPNSASAPIVSTSTQRGPFQQPIQLQPIVINPAMIRVPNPSRSQSSTTATTGSLIMANSAVTNTVITTQASKGNHVVVETRPVASPIRYNTTLPNGTQIFGPLNHTAPMILVQHQQSSSSSSFTVPVPSTVAAMITSNTTTTSSSSARSLAISTGATRPTISLSSNPSQSSTRIISLSKAPPTVATPSLSSAPLSSMSSAPSRVASTVTANTTSSSRLATIPAATTTSNTSASSQWIDWQKRFAQGSSNIHNATAALNSIASRLQAEQSTSRSTLSPTSLSSSPGASVISKPPQPTRLLQVFGNSSITGSSRNSTLRPGTRPATVTFPGLMQHINNQSPRTGPSPSRSRGKSAR